MIILSVTLTAKPSATVSKAPVTSEKKLPDAPQAPVQKSPISPTK